MLSIGKHFSRIYREKYLKSRGERDNLECLEILERLNIFNQVADFKKLSENT